MLHQTVMIGFDDVKDNDLVKSQKFNDRWLSKKVHIQGVVFFQA